MTMPDMTARAGEVALTQYKRPNGRQTTVHAKVGEEYVVKAEGMVFTCEVLTTGEVAIYARFDGEPESREDMELAKNVLDNDDKEGPTDKLKALIDRVHARREEPRRTEDEDVSV